MSTPRDVDDATRALLDARTRALARVDDANAAPDGTALLVVRVAGERYGLEASAVASVAELRQLTPVPHAPPEVAGLSARGGAVLPVFYLRAVLGIGLTSLPEYGRMVVLGEGAAALALAVDAVEGLERGDLDELAPPPTSLGAATRALLRGVDPSGLAVLDAKALLASERLIVDVPVPRAERS
jgi:chemotaxis signal transduction protein